MSTTNPPLPNTQLMGMPYNITGKYANAESVNLSAPLFNFPTSQGAGSVTIQGTTYSYPADVCRVSVLDEANAVVTSYEDAQAASDRYSFGVEVGYRKAMFGGSVRTSFTASYDSAASMKSVAQRSLVRTYELQLPYTLTQLQGMLTAQANSDINGSGSADQVIATYGTHVLVKGVFGGLNLFSQSLSSFNCTSDIAINAALSANYAGADGQATGGYNTINIASASQSNAIMQIFGGDPATLGTTYQQWASSLSKGNWVMVDFPHDNASLLPLAQRASSPARQQELMDAMNRALAAAGSPVPVVYGLRWINEKVGYTKGGTPDITVRVASNTQVVVGLGAGVNSKKVNRAVLHVLDMATNTTSDIYNPSPSSYERDLNVPLSVQDAYGNPLRGVAAVGVGLYADDNNMRGMTLNYQELNPSDPKLGYLSGSTQTLTWGTSEDSAYIADPGWIITEIGMGMDNTSSNLKVLHVKVAQLEHYALQRD